jgi:hypothetical protein
LIARAWCQGLEVDATFGNPQFPFLVVDGDKPLLNSPRSRLHERSMELESRMHSKERMTLLERSTEYHRSPRAPRVPKRTQGGGQGGASELRRPPRSPFGCWIVYFRDALIVRVRAYLDSVMVARLFEENPIDSKERAIS